LKNLLILAMSLKNCIALLFILAFFSFLVQSDFGNVNVKSHALYSSNKQYVIYDLYKPSSASKTNKAPFIVVIPGFQRSKEALSNIAIELSRRGNVVALIDPYAQGMSSSSLSRRAATTEGYGMFALIDTVSKGNLFDFVDTDKMASTGHSMGGNAAIRGANYFGREAIRENKKSKLHSVYVSGYVLTLSEKVLNDVRSNVGVSYALYDEGAFRNELQGWDAGNMTIAPEALRTVNSILDENQKIEVIELEKFYGEIDKNTARVIYNERLLHPFQPYNNIATANQLIYFDKVFNSDVKLDPYDQIWQWKELFTLLSMITSLIMIVPLTRFLLKLNFFSELVKEVPKPLPIQNRKGKVVFWSIFIIGATVACLTFIPMVDIAKIIFQKASNRELTWFFPQRMNNSVMLWATFNGIFGAILFFGSYYLFGRKAGIKKDSWGIKITNIEIVKTFLLGLLVFLIYYGTLNVIHFIFHVDYRFWFMGVRIFQPQMLLVLAMYFPFFFVFFLSNSLRVNGAMRFENQPEWISRLVAGLANSSGLIMIILIQYSVFLYSGSVFWMTNWLSVNLLFGIVPMMFFLPYFNRIFFEMTGRIYLGPVITCLIFIMILSTNTVVYLPI
tara:strand:- start:441 stop:2288 length:1848 start_codon:yes stop_codon:yes gene_type:complete